MKREHARAIARTVEKRTLLGIELIQSLSRRIHETSDNDISLNVFSLVYMYI